MEPGHTTSIPSTELDAAAAARELTPLMQQYVDLKTQNPDAILFFRCGDFYETFFDDAVVAARELQITLTARGKSGGNPVPLAGVPYHSAMNYVARLVQKGFSVAICEQMEDPKLAKGLVKREVVRLMTPATISDPQLLEETTNNFLVAYGRRTDRFCLAVAELSTGEFLLCSGDQSDERLLPDELTRLAPREILFLSDQKNPEAGSVESAPATAGGSVGPIVTQGHGMPGPNGGAMEGGCSDNSVGTRHAVSQQRADCFPWGHLAVEVHHRHVSDREATDLLAEVFPKEPKSRWLSLPPLELRTLGIMADYLLDTQRCSLDHLRLPEPYRLGDGMVLDEATLRNLELLPQSRSQVSGGTLFEVINRTRTSMGARLLKRWLLKPLINGPQILARQELVQGFFANGLLLADIREQLKNFPDLERLLTKITLGGRNPRDLQALGNGLKRLPVLFQRLVEARFHALADDVRPMPDLTGLLAERLRDDLPNSLAEGGIIADGQSPELDELRGILRDGDRWLRQFEEKERTATGIKNLRVRRNNVFGFFIEISKSNMDRAPEHYIRKQTLTTGERYITADLKDYESKAVTATEKSVAIEKAMFEELISELRTHIPGIQAVARGIAHLDTLTGLAHIARERRFVRPEIVEEPVLEVEGGRHPVVEAFLGAGEFHPNDLRLDGERRQAIITGPNMAGKSTYLRQGALITLLAQIGSFVPAVSARIGIVDRIFTRVGAADNLIRGQSTFMVEMMETSAILRHATPRSFLILDEIGRGTSTFDGLSLAWAILEHIHERLGARALFATHYHELTDLAPIHEHLFNLNVGVAHDEASGDMVFLHEIKEGPASKSYGIEVARLAGIPETVIDRAKEILFELEKSEEEEVGRVTRTKRKTPESQPQQLSLFTPSHAVVEALQGLDINTLTPLEALQLLARLKELANG